jgi:hypothetical protein
MQSILRQPEANFAIAKFGLNITAGHEQPAALSYTKKSGKETLQE